MAATQGVANDSQLLRYYWLDPSGKLTSSLAFYSTELMLYSPNSEGRMEPDPSYELPTPHHPAYLLPGEEAVRYDSMSGALLYYDDTYQVTNKVYLSEDPRNIPGSVSFNEDRTLALFVTHQEGTGSQLTVYDVAGRAPQSTTSLSDLSLPLPGVQEPRLIMGRFLTDDLVMLLVSDAADRMNRTGALLRLSTKEIIACEKMAEFIPLPDGSILMAQPNLEQPIPQTLFAGTAYTRLTETDGKFSSEKLSLAGGALYTHKGDAFGLMKTVAADRSTTTFSVIQLSDLSTLWSFTVQIDSPLAPASDYQLSPDGKTLTLLSSDLVLYQITQK